MPCIALLGCVREVPICGFGTAAVELGIAATAGLARVLVSRVEASVVVLASDDGALIRQYSCLVHTAARCLVSVILQAQTASGRLSCPI